MNDIDINSLINVVSSMSTSDNKMSVDKILKMSKVLEKMNSLKKTFPYSNQEEKSDFKQRNQQFLNKYDEKIQERGLKNVHMVLPYLDNNLQKQFAIFTKLLEVNILQDMLSESAFIQTSNRDYKKDFIHIIMENISDSKKGKIDDLVKIMNFKEIISEFDFKDTNEDIVIQNDEDEYTEEKDGFDLIDNDQSFLQRETIDLEGGFL